MYKRGNDVLSVAEATSAAKAIGFEVNEWASKFGWQLSEEGKTNGSTEKTPPIGPEQIDTPAGDSSLGDISLGLQKPNSYLIESGEKKSKREIYEENPQNKLQSSIYTTESGIDLGPVGFRQAGGVDEFKEINVTKPPTLNQQVEFEIEEEDLDKEDPTTVNIVFNPNNDNSLINRFYVSAGEGGVGIGQAERKGFFKELLEPTMPTDKSVYTDQKIDELTESNLYFKNILKNSNINLQDFEGWLKSNKRAQEFVDNLARGDFDFNESVTQSSFSIFLDAKTGLSPSEEKIIGAQTELRGLLQDYAEEINERTNKKAFAADYKANPEKYKDFTAFEDAYDSYIDEKGYIQTIGNLDTFFETNFKELTNFERKNREKFLKKISDEDGKIVGRNAGETIVDGVRNLGVQAGRGVSIDPYITILSVLGARGAAAEARLKKSLADQRLAHLSEGIYLVPPAGKKAVVDGTEYLLDDNGVLYNTSAEIVASTYMDPKELSKISAKVKADGKETKKGNLENISWKGGFIQGAGTVGALFPQIAGMRGIGTARAAASSKYINTVNKIRKSRGLGKINTRARGANGKFISTKDTFGVKVPFNKAHLDNALFSAYYGYQNVSNSTFEAAKKAGFTEDEAYELSQKAGTQGALLYAITAPAGFGPRFKLGKKLDKLNKWLTKPDMLNQALSVFKREGTTGFKKFFTSEFAKEFAKGSARTLSTFGKEGAKEFAQENIQQFGEFKIINRNINSLAGEEFLKQDYSVNDIINTSILSFAVGGLAGGSMDVNIPLANKHKLQAYSVIASDLNGAEQRLNESVKLGDITQEKANEILKTAENLNKYSNNFESYFATDPEDLIEAVNLKAQKEDLVKQKQNIDEDAQENINEQIADVSEKIKEVTKRARTKSIEAETKFAQKIAGKDKVVTYDSVNQMRNAVDADGNKLFTEEDLKADGLELDGIIYINKAVAIEKGAVTVASHELLHKVLKSQFSKIGKSQINLINDLRELIPPEASKRIEERLKKGNYDVKYNKDGDIVSGADIDEFITFLSDEIGLGRLTLGTTFNESAIKKIGRIITDYLKAVFGFNKEFETADDVLRFLQDYREGIKKGKVSLAVRKKIKAGEKIDTDIKKKSVSQLDTKLKENYDNSPRRLVNDMLTFPLQESEFAKEIGGITENITKRLYDPIPADQKQTLSRSEFKDALIGEAATLITNEYNVGEQSLDKFVSTRLNLRANNLASRLGIEAAITEDVSERKDIQADDDIEAEIDKPTDTKPEFKKLTEYKGNRSFISDEDTPEVNRAIARIVGAPSFKAKFDQRAPDGKQTSDFIAALKKQFGNSILVDRIKSKGIVKAKTGTAAQAFERFMLQNKKAILENMTTTYLQTAFPHAVEKSVNGVFVRFPNWLGQKIDRETTGQGNDLVRRVPNVAQTVSDQQYLEDIRTNPLKGGKEVRAAAKQNSVLKAIAEEIGIEIVTEAINDPNSDIYKALVRRQGELGVTEDQITAVEATVQSERGNVKFSYTPEAGNENIIREELDLSINAQNQTDAWLKANGYEDGLPKFKTKDDVDNYIRSLKTDLFPIMPKSFFFKPSGASTFTSSNSNLAIKSSKDPIWVYFKEQIAIVRDDKNTIFAEEIPGVDFNAPNFATLFKNEAAVKEAIANGKLKAYNEQVAEIHRVMWSRFATAIKNDKTGDVTAAIAKFLHFSTNHTTHPHRAGAQFIGYSKGFDSKGIEGGKITFEHAMPSVTSYLYLLDAAKNNYNFDRAYNAIISNYKMIALDKEADKKLGGVYKTGMPSGWKVESNYWWERYFNELVASNDGGIDPESIIMIDGKTLGETTGVTTDGTMRSPQGIEFNSEINQEALQKASEDIRKLDRKKRSLSDAEANALNKEFNDIIERKTGVESFKTFSAAQAQMRGAKKGRFKFFIAPAVDDFRGLVNYAFAGRGKQGEKDMAFLEEKLMTPYAKGIAAIDGARQQIKRDFKSLVKAFPQQYKQLNKEIGNSGFTFDQAVRVYLWQKAGLEVPGLSKKDTKLLNDAIQNNPELIDFANSLLTVARRNEWMEPGQHWLAGTVLSDLSTMTEKIGRKEYLSEFIENADVIFSPENLNKIEALFGKAHREAIEDSLYSMKNGTNRQQGTNKIVNKWLNWINGSTGAIMFFNRRSALLQMLSTTNFINWSDNNILKAGAAFANQKQFWTDWAMIYNSDKLKERRGGLRQDVSANEIASVANESKNSPQAIIAYLLKIGFKPTQLADSFAIASGGAAFYRNRVNTYLKQGLDEKAAKEQAFIDFSKKSDEAQQSSDPALVSQVQRSVLGRLVFAFQNTPMQYARLMKKAALDLKNGRGDWKENVSKIAYYGAIQNLIFSSLQSALFALIPGFDDEDEDLTDKELEKRNEQDEAKIARVLNSMVDTILRGSGIYGAVFATTKNAIREYMRQDKKDFMADHTYTILSLTDISPPISSKLRKIYSAVQTRKFEKDEIAARGWAITGEGRLDLGPNWSILGRVTSATANLPLDRAVDELTSISEAFDSRNTAYQRIALGLGWKTWDVRAKDELGEAIKAEAKKARSEAKKSAKEKTSETRTVKRKTIKRETVRRK